MKLILPILNSDIYILFRNSVDPDQLASENPADQNQHFFHSACKYMLVLRIGLKLGRNLLSVVHKTSSITMVIIENLNTAPDVIDVISNVHKLPKKYQTKLFLSMAY